MSIFFNVVVPLGYRAGSCSLSLLSCIILLLPCLPRLLRRGLYFDVAYLFGRTTATQVSLVFLFAHCCSCFNLRKKSKEKDKRGVSSLLLKVSCSDFSFTALYVGMFRVGVLYRTYEARKLQSRARPLSGL